jgi:hypothetical protein
MVKLKPAQTNMTGRPAYLRSRENNLPVDGTSDYPRKKSD